MKTALLAFDSKQLNLILSKMLGDLGFSVTTTLSFKDAVAICEKKQPEVLFVDWVFDGKNVQDLLDAITVKPCIIFVSAETAPDDISRALELGATEYIIKSFDNDILQSKLSMAGLV